MKRYLVQKKGLLTATFLLGAVTASSSALLAILLQKLIDTVLQGDGNKFFLLAIVAAGYLCFLESSIIVMLTAEKNSSGKFLPPYGKRYFWESHVALHQAAEKIKWAMTFQLSPMMRR